MGADRRNWLLPNDACALPRPPDLPVNTIFECSGGKVLFLREVNEVDDSTD
jgi:hypothetical protein